MENVNTELNDIFNYDNEKKYLEAEKEIFEKIEKLLKDKEKMEKLSKNKVACRIRDLFQNMIEKREDKDPVKGFLSSILMYTAQDTAEKLLKTKYTIEDKNPNFSIDNYARVRKLYWTSKFNLDSDDQETINKDIPRTWVDEASLCDKTLVEKKREILKKILEALIEKQKNTPRGYIQGINYMGKIIIDQRYEDLVEEKNKEKNEDLSATEKEIVNHLDIMCGIYNKIVSILAPTKLKETQTIFDKLKASSPKLKIAIELFLGELNNMAEANGYLPPEEEDLGLSFMSAIVPVCLTPKKGVDIISKYLEKSETLNSNNLMLLWIKSSEKLINNYSATEAKICAENIVAKSIMILSTQDYMKAFFNLAEKIGVFDKPEKIEKSENEMTNTNKLNLNKNSLKEKFDGIENSENKEIKTEKNSNCESKTDVSFFNKVNIKEQQ